MQFAEWPSTDIESTNFTRRDVKIGRTSTSTVLITSMDAGEDFDGATIRYITGFGGGGGGGADLVVQEEGTEVSSAATTINFTGSGATATASDGTVTVDIPGGQAGSLDDGSVTTAKLADRAVTLLKIAEVVINGLTLFPDSNGDLPDPSLAANQGRIAVSGNQLLQSIDHGGHDKVVVFKRYGTRTVLSGEPAKTTQENNYQGAFNNPPDISVYSASDLLWDRGSQIWLWKQNASDTTWRSFGGPVGFAHGSLYADEDAAARHVADADQVGKVYIIGQGSGQHVFVVTSFTAATDAVWLWDPIGITSQDAHDVAEELVSEIRVGEFDSTRSYDKGQSCFTGSGSTFTVWTANQDICGKQYRAHSAASSRLDR